MSTGTSEACPRHLPLTKLSAENTLGRMTTIPEKKGGEEFSAKYTVLAMTGKSMLVGIKYESHVCCFPQYRKYSAA